MIYFLLIAISFLFSASIARADGVYENCDTPSNICDQRLRQLSSRNLSPVLNYWTDDSEYGLRNTKMIWPVDSSLYVEWTRKEITTFVRSVRDMNKTWGYYIGEEDVVTPWAGLIHRLDPKHPRLYVDSRHLGVYADKADVLGLEYYPVGRNQKTVKGTYEAARSIVKVAKSANDKPAMILQAFQNPPPEQPSTGPWPTLNQQRRMHDLAKKGGVGFILWFDLFYMQPLGTWDTTHLDTLESAIYE